MNTAIVVVSFVVACLLIALVAAMAIRDSLAASLAVLG